MDEKINIKGSWKLKCFGPGRKLRWEDGGNNLVVTTGLNHIAALLSGGETAMGWMSAGSDNTAPAAGNTALGTELGRVALDSKTQTGGNTVVYIATFGAGTATGAWEEAGLFNAASSGTMLNRLLTTTKTKAADEVFEMQITLTISPS